MIASPLLVPIVPSRKTECCCDHCGTIQDATTPGGSPRMFLDVKTVEVICERCAVSRN